MLARQCASVTHQALVIAANIRGSKRLHQALIIVANIRTPECLRFTKTDPHPNEMLSEIRQEKKSDFAMKCCLKSDKKKSQI